MAEGKDINFAGPSLVSELSPNEIYFCELLSRGSRMSEAFATAFPKSKSVTTNNIQSLAVNAHRTKNKPTVSAYLDALMDSDKSKLVSALTRAAKRAKLAELVMTCPDYNIVLRAIDLDNDMSGDKAPRITAQLTGTLSIADSLLARFSALGEAKPVLAISEPSPIELEPARGQGQPALLVEPAITGHQALTQAETVKSV